MSELRNILKSKGIPYFLIDIIFKYINIDKSFELKNIIELKVYKLNACVSWNIWWKIHKLLSKRERSDYNIKNIEKDIEKTIKEYEKSVFIYGIVEE